MTIKTKKQKIIVGLSGGVDSAAALILLKKQGFNPIGVTLKLPRWGKNKKENANSHSQSIEIAQKICRKFKIPYFVIDAEKDFDKKVVNYFITELKNNRTPNPCVVCNRDFKFKKLFEIAKKFKANYVATGHYARLRQQNPKIKNQKPKYELLTAKDKKKDQSYMLSGLSQKDLSKIILPLGNLTKDEAYKITKKEGLNFFKRIKQSQDFCFVSGKLLTKFLKEQVGAKKGKIIDENGNILGTHEGRHFFTIGQRKGIKLPNGPYFVFGFDKKKNIVYVTKNKKNLFKKEIIVYPSHLISNEKLKKPINALVKTRYQQESTPAKIIPQGNKLKIIFKKPVFSPTPGQFAVFYKKEICLGNGVIN